MHLYHQLATWWHLFSSPADYAEEAGLYWDIISRYKPDVQTALELGSGGGNNALHLKQHCPFTLTDISPEMIRVSRKLNPECRHVVGDMRAVRLHETFDLVFIHDAIMYMTTEKDLKMVFETAKAHLNPGGILFIAPDFFKETFKPSTHHGGHDGEQGSIRYLEWTSDNNTEDTQVETEYVYLVKEAGGTVRCIHDRTLEGIFPKKTWQELLTNAGFQVTFEPIPHSELEPDSYFGIVAV